MFLGGFFALSFLQYFPSLVVPTPFMLMVGEKNRYKFQCKCSKKAAEEMNPGEKNEDDLKNS